MFKMLLPARARGDEQTARTLVAHRDTTERDYVAAALSGWGHAVIAAESATEARARLRTPADRRRADRRRADRRRARRVAQGPGARTGAAAAVISDDRRGGVRGRLPLPMNCRRCAARCAGFPRSTHERAEAAAGRGRRRTGHPRRGQPVCAAGRLRRAGVFERPRRDRAAADAARRPRDGRSADAGCRRPRRAARDPRHRSALPGRADDRLSRRSRPRSKRSSSARPTI